MCVCFENALISLESVNIFFTTFAKIYFEMQEDKKREPNEMA